MQWVLRSIYSLCHAGACESSAIIRLQNCGIVYKSGAEYKLAYEKCIVLESLLGCARTQHALFSEFNIGAANELLFLNLCTSGELRATCLGSNAHTICGRTLKENNIIITCKQSFFSEEYRT